MRVLFLTEASPVRSAVARQWFYQMHSYLNERGFTTSLNSFDQDGYDVAIIQGTTLNLIQQALEHSPKAHIGILNPGYLGYPEELVDTRNRHSTPASLQMAVDNVDFFIVTSFMWRELILPYQRRDYLTIDYDTYNEGKSVKHHIGTAGLTIGYHGNEIHYAQDFFPHGASALQRLAREHEFTLKIITSNAATQPQIEGIKTEFIEFDLNTFADEISTFDIGICPSFSTMDQLANPFTYIRGSNRVRSLLFRGIPAVASPLPQACDELAHGETVLFAVSQDGWYDALKQLITQPDLRNRIGQAGHKFVESNFSTEVAVEGFIEILKKEVECTLYPKTGVELHQERKQHLRLMKGQLGQLLRRYSFRI